MQESFWWWQFSVRYSLPLPPPPGVAGPASNISSQTTRCWTSLTKQDQITVPPFWCGCDTQIWSSGRWNTCHYKTWQCPLLAPSVHSPQMVWECACMRVCVRNVLEVCTTLAYPHISSFCTMPVLYTSTHTHPQTIWGHLMGLKMDIAPNST